MVIGCVKIRKIDRLFIRVKISREFMVRRWFALQLIKLAAIVIGGKAKVFEVEIEGVS